MAKSKYTLKSGPFSFVFLPEISTSLRDPLGCSDLSQILFGRSPIATELDKIVAAIIHTTFVFLRHPSAPPPSVNICVSVRWVTLWVRPPLVCVLALDDNLRWILACCLLRFESFLFLSKLLNFVQFKWDSFTSTVTHPPTTRNFF